MTLEEYKKQSQNTGEKATQIMIYFLITLAVHIAMEVLFPIPQKVVVIYWTFRVVGIISAIGALILFIAWIYLEILFLVDRSTAKEKERDRYDCDYYDE